MRPGRNWLLTRLNLRRDWRSFLLSALGISVGVAAFVFFVALGSGINAAVQNELFPVDARSLEVVPSRLSLGSLLGGGGLDDTAVRDMVALAGVRRVHRRLALQVPAVSRFDGDFFGTPLRMGLEIIGVGLEQAFLSEDLPPGVSFEDPKPGEPIPIFISGRLLEIYNRAFAKARGLPRLSPALLRGFRFPMTLGRSYLGGPGSKLPPKTLTLEIVGVSNRALLGGVTLPLETVRRLNRRWAGEEAATHYDAVVLEIDEMGRSADISKAVERMGFSVNDEDKVLAEQIGLAVLLTTAALSFLSFLLLALAGLAIARAAFASVEARTRELGVLRALGARRRDVVRVVVFEAGAAGLLGGLLGVGFGLASGWIADAILASMLPDFPFKPQHFFAWPWWLGLVALVAALGAATLGSLVPARKAGRSSPARALGGGF